MEISIISLDFTALINKANFLDIYTHFKCRKCNFSTSLTDF